MTQHAPATRHPWKFFRTGGLDQVALETAEDLLALRDLDEKLWVVLSCPVKGIELDEQTLALIDADGDGHVHVREVIAAVEWAAAHLKRPADLLNPAPALPLEAINDLLPDGKSILISARRILENLGKKDATEISVEDTADTAKILAAKAPNGDGVITLRATIDAEVQALIKEIIAVAGGVPDRLGGEGVNAAKIEEFFKAVQSYVAWLDASAQHNLPKFGEGTTAAFAAYNAVRAKVEDYFARCRLAEFDRRAIGALNREEKEYLALAAKDLTISTAEIAGFPLAQIDAGRAVPLTGQLNPAWAGAMDTFRTVVVTPYFGAKTALTMEEWEQLKAAFVPFESWLGSKPASPVEKLGGKRAKELLNGRARANLDALVAEDKALAPEYNAISAVARLARYYRDLRTLLHNFVNFADFYSPERWATFQAGMLYLDSRSTELCVRVEGPNTLAAMSKMYLAYCDCRRAGGETMKIAACFTQGDGDYLFVGRNGVFYDRKGRDWDATITKIVDNPISLREAFWSPYKKFIRMVEEQVAKRAAAAEAETSGKLAAAAEKTAHLDKTAAPAAPAAAPKKIDVGTVAALGVAGGVIIGTVTTIASGLARLAIWQLPLVIVALILVISLPSVAIAWLKLRQRTVGPLLEGNGWAINGRVKINIPFGATLTRRALLPENATRMLDDPYEDKEAARRKRLAIASFVFVVLAAAAIWIRWDAMRHDDADGKPQYFWQRQHAKSDKPADKPAAAPAPAAEPAKK